jgi:hypothetical protein
MKHIYLFLTLVLTAIAGCSTTENACEDVTTASEQIKMCQLLQRQITNAKGNPIIRTELERRFQVDCIDVRYYRDDKQKAICGNKHNIDEIINGVKEESKQKSANLIDKSTQLDVVAKSEVSKVSVNPYFTKVDLKQLSFTATVKYMNLEGGFFGLVSKEGKHWLPMNLNKSFQQDGAVIKVRGNPLTGVMTIQQWGTPFSITHIELISAGRKGTADNLL